MSASLQKAIVYVEGSTDLPVVSAVMRASGWGDEEFRVFSMKGSKPLEARLREQAHRPSCVPRVFLRDADGRCPVDIRRRLLPEGSADTVILRVCDSEIESWVLADNEGFARFFNIPLAKVELPEGPDAKERMLRCVDRLAKRHKEDFVRKNNKGGNRPTYSFGSRYGIILGQFVNDEWDAHRGAERSDSLARALRRLGELHDRFVSGELWL